MIGVVLPEGKRKAVAACLPAQEVARLRFVGWEGDLRPLADCQLAVVLGHPPVPPRAVADHMVQEGDAEAAAADGDWGDLPWEGQLPWGRTITVARKGYRRPK